MKEGSVGSSFENGGLLSPERVDRLNRLGFVWDVPQYYWNQRYNELIQYKETNGDTNVPISHGGLGLWVLNQRAKQSGMTTARKEALKSIGFEFDLGSKIRSAADERWLMRLNELKEYHDKWATFSVKQNVGSIPT